MTETYTDLQAEEAIATSGGFVSAVHFESHRVSGELESRGMTVRNQDVQMSEQIQRLGLSLPELSKQIAEGRGESPARLAEPQRVSKIGHGEE